MTLKKSYLKLFWHLLKADFYIFKKSSLSHCINSAIWSGCTIIAFSYIFTLVGITNKFGIFIAVGLIVSCTFWSTWAISTIFISDIEGDRTINYFLTLPLPNYFILIEKIISYAISSGLPSLVVLPMIKILLWRTFDLSNFSTPKFIIIYILTTLFVGAFSLFITSQVKSMSHIENISMRFLFPLWFFSGSNYPWKLINSVAPTLAKINLLNPLLYPMEGIRVAVLGQPGYINFWICVLMLIIFTILFGFLGINKLKKRLDFV